MNANFIRWDIDPEIVNVLGLSLRYYGVLFAGGLLLCVVFLKSIFKKENIAASHLDTLTIYGVLGIFLGARLAHCFFYDPSYYIDHPLEVLLPIQLGRDGAYHFIGYQGLASHGGVAGLIVALILYARKTNESVINTIDLISVVAPLGGFFIRLANLMNSEIIGLPTEVPWAFVFVREDNLPRHPAQLYEAIAYLAIFVLTYSLYNTQRNKFRNGAFFGIAFSLVFIARFFIEFLKERQVAFEEHMTLDMGQLLSIPFILIGVGFAVYGLMKTKKGEDASAGALEI